MPLIWEGPIIQPNATGIVGYGIWLNTHRYSEIWLSLRSKQVWKTQNPFQSKVLHTAGFRCPGGKKRRRKIVDPHHQRLRNHTALFGNSLQSALKHQIKEVSKVSLKKETLQVSKLRQIRFFIAWKGTRDLKTHVPWHPEHSPNLSVLHTRSKVQNQTVQIPAWGMNSNNTMLQLKLRYIKHYGETTFHSKDHLGRWKWKPTPTKSFPKKSSAFPKTLSRTIWWFTFS